MSASIVFLKHHYRGGKKKERQRINGGRMQCRNANWMESFNKSYAAHLTQIGFARHSLPLPTLVNNPTPAYLGASAFFMDEYRFSK